MELERLLSLSDADRGWSLLKGARPASKGKSKANTNLIYEFEKERGWLRRNEAREEMKRIKLQEEEILNATEPAEIECGCCFTKYRFSAMGSFGHILPPESH